MAEPVTVISAFEVTPDADAAFIAARRSAAGEATLFRALRADVRLRFVEIARGAVPDGHAVPTHAGRYEAVHEDGAPDGAEGVTVIAFFEVAPEDSERFVAGWHRARDAFAAQRGFLGARLHRSVGPAAFRFVDVARWSSPLMVARAERAAEVREATATMPFASHRAVFQVVDG